MRYLRMITNALVSAVLAAAYLCVLVLQLNPHVAVASETTLRWFLALLALYGPYLAAGILLLILAGEAIVARPLHPGWLSLRILAWLGASLAVAAAVLTWANLEGLRAMMSDAAAERMRQGAAISTACAAMLVGVALLRYSFGRRGNRPAALLLVASVVASVGGPLWARGPGEIPVPPARRASAAAPISNPPRIRLLLLDGSSKAFLLNRVAAGQLPNFATLLDRGARIDLTTLRPTQTEPVWTAVATGKYPPKNGIRSEFVYLAGGHEPDPVTLLPDYCFAQALLYQGFVRAEPLQAAALQARPLWDILGDYQISSGVVNWPLTRAASIARGYLLSDAFDEAMSSPIRSGDPRAGDPTTVVDIARPVFDRWLAMPWTDILPGTGPDDLRSSGLRRARWDRAYLESEIALTRWLAPRLTAIRLEAGDELGHLYLREAQPELFGARRAADPRRSLLDRYYAVVDGVVARLIDETAPGDLLLVVSGFGMERTPLIKRLLSRLLGEGELTGSHEAAPDGYLFAFGSQVAPGEYRRGSVVDVAPTVLYYMGVPVGRDMDGFARTDLFRPAFTRDRPVTYTLTHER